MDVKELIEKLKELPQDLPVRAMDMYDVDALSEPNKWVEDVEFQRTGSSGYEVSGEVVLLTSE
jgi:hypothetical protein